MPNQIIFTFNLNRAGVLSGMSYIANGIEYLRISTSRRMELQK